MIYGEADYSRLVFALIGSIYVTGVMIEVSWHEGSRLLRQPLVRDSPAQAITSWRIPCLGYRSEPRLLGCNPRVHRVRVSETVVSSRFLLLFLP